MSIEPILPLISLFNETSMHLTLLLNKMPMELSLPLTSLFNEMSMELTSPQCL